MLKNVIKPSEIRALSGGLKDIDTVIQCYDCKSALFYFKIVKGIVAEEDEWQVVGHKSKRSYNIRTVGMEIFCAECGDFLENYNKFFYPEDKLLMYDLDIMDDYELAEIENCLVQYNQKRSFTSRYDSNVFKQLKEKLDEYEKNHPEHNQNKIKTRRKVK